MGTFKQCLPASPSCSIAAAGFSCLEHSILHEHLFKVLLNSALYRMSHFSVETISDELMNASNTDGLQLFQPLTVIHEEKKYVLKYV